MTALLTTVNDALYAYGLVGLLVATGVYLTWRTRAVQVRLFGHMLRHLTRSRAGAQGGISSFQAFAIGMATRIGIGNIAGVAIALILGGPGAIFWMWAVSLVVPSPGRYVLWAVAVIISAAGPLLATLRSDAVPLQIEHLPERFALLVLDDRLYLLDDERTQHRLAGAGEDDVRALRVQAGGDGAADAAGRAGDQGSLAGKVEHAGRS